MFTRLLRYTLLGVILLIAPSTGFAQINIPNVFTPQTRILSSEVNANFAALGADALNRTGGTMIGTLTTQLLIPDGNNTRALGASGTRWSTVFGVAGNYSGVLSTTDTSAGSLDIGGGLNAGTGNVAIIGVDGRIPSIDSTRFASLSGANLTSIPETAITDGTILARVGSTETITGNWVFSSAISLQSIADASAATIRLRGRAADNIATAFFQNNAGSVTQASIQSEPTVLRFFGPSAEGLRLTSTALQPLLPVEGLQVGAVGAAAAGKIGLSANALALLGGSAGHAFLNSGGGVTTAVDAPGNWSMGGRINSATAQPGFLAYNSADDTAQSSGATVVTDSERFDNAGNHSNGVFTAPVTGQYLFCSYAAVTPSATTMVLVQLQDNASGFYPLAAASVTSGETSINTAGGCTFAVLTSGQTISARVYVNEGTFTIQGSSSNRTYFSGRLVP